MVRSRATDIAGLKHATNTETRDVRDRAIAAAASGKFAQAAALFAEVVRDDANDVYAQLKLGDAQVHLGHWKEALASYLASARHYITLDEGEKAARICASMWGLIEGRALDSPEFSEWALEIANTYVFLDRVGEAFTIFDRMAQAALDHGCPAEAERHLKYMVGLAPEAPRPYLRLAEIRLSEGDSDGAVSQMKLGAGALAQLNLVDDVLRVYERILEVKPDAEVARELARQCLERGTPEEARRAFRALRVAFKADEGDLVTLKLMARYFELVRNTKEALKALKAIVLVARRTGDDSAFVEARDQLVAFAPNDPEVELLVDLERPAWAQPTEFSVVTMPPGSLLPPPPTPGDFSLIARLPVALAADSARSEGRVFTGFRNEVEHLFPHPIAFAFHTLRTSAGTDHELLQYTNVAGVALRFLAVVARAERLACAREGTPIVEKTLEDFAKPRSDGFDLSTLKEDWKALEGSAGLGLLGGLIDPAARGRGIEFTAFHRAMSELDLLIQRRNVVVHRKRGSGPDPDDLDQIKDQVLKFLRCITPIEDHILAVPRSECVKDTVKQHRCDRLVGHGESFEQTTIECDLDLEQGHVYLFSPEEHRVLSLHPFYVLARCDDPREGCGGVHLFSLETLADRRAEYVSMQGHRLRLRKPYLELEASRLNDRYTPTPTGAKYLRGEAVSEPEQYPAGKVIDQRYRVIRCIRRGSMSVVYLVADVDHHRECVVKLLPADKMRDTHALSRFQREARQLKRISHPNIISILEVRMVPGERYIAMELAPGWKTAAGRALDLGDYPLPLSLGHAVSVACELCGALDYVHNQGLIHRDIKPSNVLLFGDGHVKLADFGLARPIETAGATLSAYGTGTELYMSPEQLRGARDLPPSADLYSLGLVLFELFSGRRPFWREHPTTEASARLKDDPPQVCFYEPLVPTPINDVIMQCLERDPGRRPRSAREVRSAILEYLPAGEIYSED